MKWSKYQSAIFDAVVNTENHIIVQARAGAGKTTTITAAMDMTQSPDRALVAHNKHIAAELGSRTTAEVRTLHSMGFQTLRDHSSHSIEVKPGKGRSIARKVVEERVKLPKTKEEQKSHRMLPDRVKQISSLIKATGCEELHEIEDLVWDHGLYMTTYPARTLAVLGRETCKRSLEDTKTIDFDDMLYQPRKLNFLPRRYQTVAVDESQDLNKSQLWLVANAAERLVLVGDAQQAIYGWRGAEANLLDTVGAKLKATHLPLSITYRCATSIVDHVKKLFPALSDFTAREGAPEGSVSYVSSSDLNPKPGDFVLCRWNAPLVKHALRLMLQGVPVCLLGRGLAKHLQSIFAKCKEESQFGMMQWVNKEEAREVAFLLENSRTSLVAEITDRYAILKSIIRSGRDVRRTLGSLFVDERKPDVVAMSTVHRAKGLEADRVWLLKEGLIKPGKIQEEDNIQYVGVTRAKNHLFLVGK